MYEFGFDRRTLRALALGLVLLAVLTAAAGALTGMLWVDRQTPGQRFATRVALLEGSRSLAVAAVVSSEVLPAVGVAVANERIPLAPAAPAESTARASLSMASGTGSPTQQHRWPRLWQPMQGGHGERALAWRALPIDLRFETTDSVPETPFGAAIYEAARRHAISPELVAAMVEVESSFDPRALSSRGARGLLQVLPATGRRFGVSDAEDLYQPEINLEAGLCYLRWLGERFAGDSRLMLAAYNAGEGAVEKYAGLPPFRETQRYLERIDSVLDRALQRRAEPAVGSAADQHRRAAGR